MSNEKNEIAKKEINVDLARVITTALKVPGVRVSREAFLRDQFKDISKDKLEEIVEKGPVEAGCSRDDLKRKADRIIKGRTAVSAGASFIAGIPGGLAMAATIPADMMQFYAIALRIAQELIYLYGESDLWCEGTTDSKKVTNQLILYCGVMLGASGSVQTVRVMSSALAKQALKKLPQKALMKTIYYPVIKSILKFFGVSITKKTFANGISKAIPVVGGVVSGGITLASMIPMGNRLAKTLDKAHFDYTIADFEADMDEISKLNEQQNNAEKVSYTNDKNQDEDVLSKIQKAKKLFDDGIISEEEFAEIKSKLISQM